MLKSIWDRGISIKIRRVQKVQDLLTTELFTLFNDRSFLIFVEKMVGLVVDESLDDVLVASFTGDQERRKVSVSSWVKIGSF